MVAEGRTPARPVISRGRLRPSFLRAQAGGARFVVAEMFVVVRAPGTTLSVVFMFRSSESFRVWLTFWVNQVARAAWPALDPGIGVAAGRFALDIENSARTLAVSVPGRRCAPGATPAVVPNPQGHADPQRPATLRPARYASHGCAAPSSRRQEPQLA